MGSMTLPQDTVGVDVSKDWIDSITSADVGVGASAHPTVDEPAPPGVR
jgi:hypothetical protein